MKRILIISLLFAGLLSGCFNNNTGDHGEAHRSAASIPSD